MGSFAPARAGLQDDTEREGDRSSPHLLPGGEGTETDNAAAPLSVPRITISPFYSGQSDVQTGYHLVNFRYVIRWGREAA